MSKKFKSPDKEQNRMADLMDELNEFQSFREKVLPQVRRMLLSGKKAEDIYKHFRDELAARKISIALDPSVDAGKALTAIMDIENRLEGKPTEKREIEHKFAQLPEQQIDALILSELDLSDIELIPDDSNEPDPDKGGMPEA